MADLLRIARGQLWFAAVGLAVVTGLAGSMAEVALFGALLIVCCLLIIATIHAEEADTK